MNKLSCSRKDVKINIFDDCFEVSYCSNLLQHCSTRPLKFRYSEKATQKFGSSTTLFWHYLVASNYKWKIRQIVVTFSGYLNFIKSCSLCQEINTVYPAIISSLELISRLNSLCSNTSITILQNVGFKTTLVAEIWYVISFDKCSILLQTQSGLNHSSYRNFHFNEFVANPFHGNIGSKRIASNLS